MILEPKIIDEMKPALQGVIPSTIVTCSIDGEPNVAHLSQVYYVDDTHVALSYQFFNKTKRNIRENPTATVKIISPVDLMNYILEIEFDHSEMEGPLFDAMEMQLEAIASMSGMSDVFKLLGADVYKIVSAEKLVEDLMPTA